MTHPYPAPTSLQPIDFDPFAETGDRTLPLTEQQREMYAVAQMGDEANCAYNQCFALSLRGPLSEQSLRNALQHVVQRHDALRLRILDDERQEVLASIEAKLALVDVSTLEAPQRDAAIRKLLDDETRTAFDLRVAPLWRAQLVREAAELHRLVFTAHHIVADGWSSAVIFGDLARAYVADRFGLAAQLPQAAPYAEFVGNSRSAAAIDEARAAEDYWVRQFAGGVPYFELPFDRPRPRFRSYAAAQRTWSIDSALYQAVRLMGVQQGATLFVALLAAFEVLVARLSASDDLVIGVPMASQALQDNGHLVAHGVNTIPLRSRLNMQHSFAEHLRNVRKEFLDAQAHQRLTFGTLVHRLKLPRDASRNPLVSVIFNIDRIGSPFDFGEVDVEGVETPKSFYNFEFGVNAVDNGESLMLECEYNSDLFDATTIDHWLEAYEAILRSAVADGSQSLGRLGMLSTRARQELLDLQPARTPYEPDVLMHEFIERQVDQTPQRPALTFNSQTISYAEVDARANRVAQALRRMGVTRGVAVGLCVDRSIDMVVAIIGILKAGGAHVPMDPAFPPERLRFMAQDAALAVVITETQHLERTGLTRDRALVLDEAAALAAMPMSRLPRDANSAAPDTSAYIIYTSGSTGKPKGVQVSHGAIANLIASLQRVPGIEASDTLVAVTTLSFDIAVLELILPLTVGARVVVAERNTARDADSLRRLLETSGATLMQSTPSGWRLLLESGWRGHQGFKAIAGGEPLAPDLATALLARCASVWNGYGPTETTVYSTFWQVGDPQAGISIGRPIANTTVWILDDNQQPCVRGVPGEICIGGDGVTPGYLNRPELNEDRFVTDRLDPVAGRLYRTGDRGRWLPNGTLEHLGRMDFQVKVRGYRIELGEIEANLLAHPGIARAVVITREDRAGDVRLIAYVVPQPGHVVAGSELRQHLQKSLPEYFVPQLFVELPAIPVLPNGKIDRKALPPPTEAVVNRSDTAAVLPRTATETLVVSVFAEVLDRRGIGVHDDFFDLGGHSLMAARVMAKLRAAANVDLPLRNLFDRPTPEGLAAAIDALAWTAESATPGNTGDGEREEIEL
jgi:amino acid adenylation domain-containing protein